MSDPFPTTQWSELFSLRNKGSEGHRLALAHLYQRYWSPLYAFLRRRGFDPDQSADLLQGFFAYLLDKDVVAKLDLSGKLRAFLIATLKHYLSDVRDKELALKRNAGRELLSLDVDAAERTYREIPSSEMTPDELYEQRWALELVRRAQERLEQTEINAGRAEAFSALRAHVFGGLAARPYREVSVALGMNESAIKVRVHRLRKRLGRFLREDIELTVGDKAAVDGEVRYLVGLVG